MTNIATIEDQLKAEYGAVKGWIAAHVYGSIGIAFGAGQIVALIFRI